MKYGQVMAVFLKASKVLIIEDLLLERFSSNTAMSAETNNGTILTGFYAE